MSRLAMHRTGRTVRLLAWSIVMMAATAGCRGEAPRPADAPPLADIPTDAPMMHGNHDPKFGGLVMMYGDLHFEVVLDGGGRHRVYFSDAYRQDLPASVVPRVALTIERPDAPPEPLDLQIDDAGESWIASGRAVAEPEAMARVAFTYDGEPYEIEVPFTKPVADPATDPHAVQTGNPPKPRP